MTLAERFDTELLKVFEVEVFENDARDIVHAKLFHKRIFKTKPDHPICDLPGRPGLQGNTT